MIRGFEGFISCRFFGRFKSVEKVFGALVLFLVFRGAIFDRSFAQRFKMLGLFPLLALSFCLSGGVFFQLFGVS